MTIMPKAEHGYWIVVAITLLMAATVMTHGLDLLHPYHEPPSPVLDREPNHIRRSFHSSRDVPCSRTGRSSILLTVLRSHVQMMGFLGALGGVVAAVSFIVSIGRPLPL